MLNFQKILLGGHLGKDAIQRVSQVKGKAIFNFSLAVHNDKKTHTEWFKCVFFTTVSSAEQLNLNESLYKGANVLVQGKFETKKSTYQGKSQSTTSFIVSDLQVIKKGKKESAKVVPEEQSEEELHSEEPASFEQSCLDQSEEPAVKAIPKDQSKPSKPKPSEFSEENPFASAFAV